jgi:hypothetical protein
MFSALASAGGNASIVEGARNIGQWVVESELRSR